MDKAVTLPSFPLGLGPRGLPQLVLASCVDMMVMALWLGVYYSHVFWGAKGQGIAVFRTKRGTKRNSPARNPEKHRSV